MPHLHLPETNSLQPCQILHSDTSSQPTPVRESDCRPALCDGPFKRCWQTLLLTHLASKPVASQLHDLVNAVYTTSISACLSYIVVRYHTIPDSTIICRDPYCLAFLLRRMPKFLGLAVTTHLLRLCVRRVLYPLLVCIRLLVCLLLNKSQLHLATLTYRLAPRRNWVTITLGFTSTTTVRMID